jgi:hypothetical protein
VSYRRILYLVLALALLACLHVAERRERQERLASRVEIVIDDGDFAALARTYGYEQEAFLRRLKGAGLTGLAISEELGSALPGSGHADAYTGGALIDQAVLAPLRDPLLSRLSASNALRADEIYVLAYDAPTARRFAEQLPLKFPRAVRTLRTGLPALWAVRTQSDAFNNTGLGLPAERVALAQRLGLDLVPRLQNDQTFTDAQIAALVASAVQGARATTAIFFGLHNEVLGYPDRLEATAEALRAHKLNFGTVEVYDPRTLQPGNDELGRRMPARVVRVQAIGKSEQDRLRAEDILERFTLGARERNVRVVYFRPYAHPWNGLPVDQANVALVGRLADNLRRAGLTLGPSVGFEHMSFAPWEIALASLAVPAIVLIGLDAAFGWGGFACLGIVVAITLLLFAAGVLTHRELFVRQLLALIGAVSFPTVALLAIGWAFRGESPFGETRPLDNPYLRGLLALVVATVVTLGGALVVIGLLSTPLTMTEIARFAGVKYLLVLPPLAGLVLYTFARPLGNVRGAQVLASPVAVVQLAAGVVLAAGALLVLVRSGNQPDVAPSSFELALRSHLTALLQVRPRFKEFMVGFPALMLLPALVPADRRQWGWLFVVAIGLGLADVVDTFSHLHTALLVSVVRAVNGAVIGALIGALAIAVYRFVRVR